MIDTKEFVRELKRYGVVWNEKEHKHFIHNRVVSNNDMRIMCIDNFKNEYNDLTTKQQKLIRESIFEAIRYE